MKKLIMFVMVLMLCLGLSTAKADLVAGYGFGGTLDDVSGENPGVAEGTVAYSSLTPPLGGGGDSLQLTGTGHVEIPTFDTCLFVGDKNFSIVFWFKTSQEGAILVTAGSDGPTSACEVEHSMAMFLNAYSESDNTVQYDNVCIGGAQTDKNGLDNDAWHHYAVTYTAATQTFNTYLEGALDLEGGGPPESFNPEFICSDTTLILGNMLNAQWLDEMTGDSSGAPYIGLLADVGFFDHVLSLDEVKEYRANGFQMDGPRNPIFVDPNASMLLYETNPDASGLGTESAFRVSLNFRPEGQGPGNQGDPYTLTVLIDPNGATGSDGDGNYGEAGSGISQKDIFLLDGTAWETTKNQITLTFTPTTSYGYDANCPEYALSNGVGTSCWDYPVEILFQAIDDPCAEPPSLVEAVPIAVTMTSNVAEPNLNGTWDSEKNPWETGDPKWVKIAGASVKDNDQATILSVKPDGESEQLTPYFLLEEILTYDWYGEPEYRTETVRIKLQIPLKYDADPCTPELAYVKVIMEREGGGEEGEPSFNPPTAVPPLLPDGPVEPNAIIFTNDGGSVPGVYGGDFHKWDVPYTIVIQGIDDDKLQVEPGDSDGSQNYGASLEFSVVESTDKRYGESVQQVDDQGNPIVGLFEWEALDLSVPIDIQDNECGAFGIFPLDLVGNPNETTDPNIPDCYVDMWDILSIAASWLDCDDPHYPLDCAPFPDPYLNEEE